MLSAEKKLHIQLTMSFFIQHILLDGSFVAVQEMTPFNHAGNASFTFPTKVMAVLFSPFTKQFMTHIALYIDLTRFPVQNFPISVLEIGNFSIFRIFQFPFSSLPLLISQISLKILSKSALLNTAVSFRELWTEGKYTDGRTDQLDSSKRNTGDLLERTLEQQKSNKKSPTLGIYI